MNRDPNQPTSTADLAYGRQESADERMPANDRPPADERVPMDGNGAGNEARTPLVPEAQSAEYSQRWHTVQAEFVDEPQQAVKDADALVAEVIQMLAKNFAEQRQGLEEQWSRGTEVSTEDLRQALMQYRSFFQRLLAA